MARSQRIRKSLYQEALGEVWLHRAPSWSLQEYKKPRGSKDKSVLIPEPIRNRDGLVAGLFFLHPVSIIPPGIGCIYKYVSDGSRQLKRRLRAGAASTRAGSGLESGRTVPLWLERPGTRLLTGSGAD